MGFGVKEARTASGEHVPGTALIYSGNGDSVELAIQTNLKHGRGKQSDIILVPQPSDSPNDPLNWPQWKKYMTFFSLCLSVSMGGALGPILSPVTGVIAEQMHVSIAKAALPGGYPLMTTALGGFLAQAWAPILGKRSFYLASTAILFASTLWTGQVKTFNSLLAARTFQGLGTGAYESIVISSIGDLFFVHERGKMIIAYTIVAIGAATLTPMLGGYISDTYGWPMQLHILTGFTAVAFLFMLFACPETTYVRPIIYETDMRSTEGLEVSGKEAEKTKTTTIEILSPVASQSPAASAVTLEKPKTYLEELKIFNGRYSQQNPLVLLARPFVCFLYPAVLWGFFVGGLWSSWSIGLAIVVAQIFSPPPNLFTPTKLGLLFTMPFVFLLAGCLLGIFLADWWPKWCARRNNGVFEPEFRLILLIPVLWVGIPGMFGFGYYASRQDVKWVAASTLQGLIGFSGVLAGSVSYGYILDCYRSKSIEVSVATLLLRNFFWFGSSYFLPQWLAETKTWKVFDIVGSLQLSITLCSIFIYVYGKQLRNFYHRKDPMKFFHLD